MIDREIQKVELRENKYAASKVKRRNKMTHLTPKKKKRK